MLMNGYFDRLFSSQVVMDYAYSYVCYDRWFVQHLLLLKVFKHSCDHYSSSKYSLIFGFVYVFFVRVLGLVSNFDVFSKLSILT
jgi:hypothetical protein